MTIGDVRAVCYSEQKVLVRLTHAFSARFDSILAVGEFGHFSNKDDVLNREVDRMYTRDDGYLVIVVMGRD